MTSVNKTKFFQAAATYLVKKGISFKFSGEYLQCNAFTLSPHVTEPEMWIEDDLGCWIKFTEIAKFKEYLNKRQITNRTYQ